MVRKRVLIGFLVVLLIGLLFSANAALAADTKKNTVKFKLGQFAPKTSDIVGIPVNVDSGGAWSLAWESRMGSSDEFSMGMSIDGATNDIAVLGLPAGDLKTLALMLNGRYYIPVGETFDFFVGAGVGLLSTKWTLAAGISTTVNGFATQILAGVDVHLTDSFSVGVEAKHLYAKPEDAVEDYIDMSGPVILATVGLHF